MRVMVVDDATLIRQRMLAAFLKAPEVSAVSEATSGEEALALTDGFNPDVVLLDLMLPGMSGLEVLEVLTKRHPTTKVLVFTNYPYPAFRRRCLELGAAHFLGKSTDVEHVLELALGKPTTEATGDVT
ncbi:MAG TPA: response regulator transcription factor [Longimicrobiales bacterium]|nr:response regulator transcription factor [Longimicrobiales bacterium]